MRAPTFTSSFIMLAFTVALVQPKALAWTCESICANDQRDCLNWKKSHCPIETSKPFPNRVIPTQQKTPNPLRENQGCCALGADCLAGQQPCAPSSGKKPGAGILYQMDSSPGPALFPASPHEPAPAPIRGLDKEIKPQEAELEGQTRPDVRASRLFSGPGQFPPSEFAAYGIVAFQALASDSRETERYRSICRGYLAAIPAATSLRKEGISLKEQMVTVWPLTEKYLATKLNSGGAADANSCGKIIASTSLLISHDVIHKANKLSHKAVLNGRGPYLIAWSPATAFGKTEAAVLVLDLSNVTTSEGAVAIFQDWADKIEKNPQLWKGGWNMNSLRLSLQFWADRWGTGVLAILSPTSK